jgi:hypothetical protein
MCIKLNMESHEVIVEPHEWETGLEKIGILNLLEISHFGRSAKVNICVKILLRCIHEGFLCLDRPMSIDTQLIVWTTGFPLAREDPLPLFTDKYKDKSLVDKMKDKYDRHRGACSLEIASINDDTISFAT